MFGALKTHLRNAIGFNPLGLIKAEKAMKRRIAEFLPSIEDGSDGPETAVIVTPWQGTSIPWFTIVVALMMAKSGAGVRFIVDDLPYGRNQVRHALVSRAIRRVMKMLEGRFEVTYLRDYGPVPLNDDQRGQIARLAELNATWALRGEMKTRGRNVLIRSEIAQNSTAMEHITGFFEETAAPAVLFVPGGVFGHSGGWFYEAGKRDIRVASFDAGGYETTMLAADGMACQLGDVPRAFEALRQPFDTDPAVREWIIDRADLEIGKRRRGVDAFESQLQGGGRGGEQLDQAILLALNSSWDAAALGLHRAYSSNTEWIVETVRYILEKTERSIVVRQHPAERLPIAATSDDYRALLEREFGHHPRLHFIAADDPINSYELLEQVTAVVAHSSTIGVEAVAFGRPVITGSESYYAKLGFVECADTRDAYERLLEKAADGRLEVSEADRAHARLCFYITQCCNWVFSPFNPSDFWRWINEPIAFWHSQAAIDKMIDALISGVPVAILNHKSAIASAHAAGDAQGGSEKAAVMRRSDTSSGAKN